MAHTEGDSQRIPLDDLMAYLNNLVTAFEQHPDEETREAVFSLLQGIDALHREALQRLFAFLKDRQMSHVLVQAALADRLLRTVFNLYDLLPEDVVLSDVEAALARVRPYIESHGGSLKVLRVEGGVVHLEMGGACQGCPGSAITLRRGIRQALQEDFAGFEEVVVHEPAVAAGVSGANGLIGLDQIYAPPSLMQAPEFIAIAHREDVPPGQMKQVTLEDVRLLLANVNGDIYAAGDMCPGSMLPLSTGILDSTIVTCPWHQERFDLRTGQCVDKAGRRDNPRLPIYPIAINNDEIEVAINVSARPPLIEVQDAP